MRITTDNGHARQGCTLLRAHNVHNALSDIVHVQFGNTKLQTIGVQGFYLDTRYRIDDAFQTTAAFRLGGRDIVIRRCQIGVGTPGFAACQAQPFEGLR